MITTIISATAIILSTIISAICSYIITKKSTLNSIDYDMKKYHNYTCEYASIIRLDICTALYQCIRTLKNLEHNKINEIYPLPLNKNYSKAVAIISNNFSLKEISYIYQLYGIMERVNMETEVSKLKNDYELLLKKVYIDENKFINNIDIETISYIEIIDNEYIKKEYRDTFLKLEQTCCRKYSREEKK